MRTHKDTSVLSPPPGIFGLFGIFGNFAWEHGVPPGDPPFHRGGVLV